MSSHSSLTTAAELAAPLLPSGLDALIINGAYTNPNTAFMPPSAYSSRSQAEALHDDMHASLDTNVLGVVYSINAFLPLILKGKVKKIIVISTGLADTDLAIPADGRDGNPVQVTYSAMKAALNMVVAKFAAELKPKDVKLLALSPGVVNTKETAREFLCLLCRSSAHLDLFAWSSEMLTRHQVRKRRPRNGKGWSSHSRKSHHIGRDR